MNVPIWVFLRQPFDGALTGKNRNPIADAGIKSPWSAEIR